MPKTLAGWLLSLPLSVGRKTRGRENFGCIFSFMMLGPWIHLRKKRVRRRNQPALYAQFPEQGSGFPVSTSALLMVIDGSWTWLLMPESQTHFYDFMIFDRCMLLGWCRFLARVF